MDDTDRQLVSLLRKDARTSVATLATKLGVSRGTVTNRMRKLEDDQVIVGYTLRLRPDAEQTRSAPGCGCWSMATKAVP